MSITNQQYYSSGAMAGELSPDTETLEKSSDANTRLPPSTAAPEYPYNNAMVTRAGHEMHWDDTPGRERIRMAHRAGTYFEISEDGRKVELVSGNDYKYTKGGLTLTVDKNGDIKIGGNIRLVVGGDAHIEIKGSATAAVGGDLTVAANKNAEIHAGGDATVTSGKDITATAGHNMYTSVGGNMTAVVNGDMTSLINGNSDELVYGNKNVQVSGSYNITAASVSILANSSLNMSGDVVSTHAASMNKWDVYGSGYVYKYTSGSYSIKTYTNGVPSTSSSPSPPQVPTS
jgi:hypothetical protein